MTTPPTLLRLLALLALALPLAACAPTAAGPAAPTTAAPTDSSPAARTASVAFHRMEIGRLETGAYTTNVLVDLTLPPGVRWTVEDFTGDGYSLVFTADDEPGAGWRVTPAGVTRVAAG